MWTEVCLNKKSKYSEKLVCNNTRIIKKKTLNNEQQNIMPSE